MSEFSILIFEQNERIAVYLQSSISDFGYNAHAISNPADILQKSAELNPEVVVLNISGDNKKPGLELASNIAETSKAGFVFISDKPLPEQTNSDSLSFLYELVLQPFEKSELKSTIDAIIQKVPKSEKPNVTELSPERDDADNLFVSATINEGMDNLTDSSSVTLKKEPPSTKIGDTNPSVKSAENILESVLELTYGSEGKEGLLVQLTDLLSSAIPEVDFVSAYYLENQKAELLYLAGMTPDNMDDLATLPYSSGMPWTSIISEVPEYIKDTNDSKFINDAEKKIGFKSCISLPIRQSGITIGSLNLFSIHSAGAFSQEIFSLMNTIARQVELAFSYIGKANELIELEQRFQNLINNCPLGVMLIDNAATVYQCNRRAAEIFQSTSDKIVGMEIKEIDPDIRAIVTSGYTNAPVLSNFHKYGFRGAVIKPFKIEELTKTVKDVIIDKNINSLPI